MGVRGIAVVFQALETCFLDLSDDFCLSVIGGDGYDCIGIIVV